VVKAAVFCILYHLYKVTKVYGWVAWVGFKPVERFEMSRKSINFLRGSVDDGRVTLTCYKTENQSDEAFKTFTVYRLETPDYTFNTDYKEFFDGLNVREGVEIYHGPLECTNNLKFTFHD
jgi:hypothetical protein